MLLEYILNFDSETRNNRRSIQRLTNFQARLR